jgi:hypothetical protein
MPKPNFGQPLHGEKATATDVHQILGAMNDGTLVTVMALHPSVAQLEEARLWLNGTGDDVLGKKKHPLDGVVAQIFDMLTVEEEEEPRATPR